MFKTYDIRDLAKNFTREKLIKLGNAIGKYFYEDGVREIIIGKDKRYSSEFIFRNLVRGISNYLKIYFTPESTTPLIRYYCNYLRIAGINITASHLPEEYNGIKLFNQYGEDIGDNELKIIKEYYNKSNLKENLNPDIETINIFNKYLEELENIIKKIDFSGNIKLYIGKNYKNIFYKVYKQFNIEDFEILEDNKYLDPTTSETKKLVRNIKFGFVFDGDADRSALIVDGKIIDAYKIYIMLAKKLKEFGKKIVVEVFVPKILEKLLDTYNIKVERSRTGRFFVINKVKKRGVIFGGEYSYHLILKPFNYLRGKVFTDDGILNSLIILKLFKSIEKIKEELEKIPEIYIRRYSVKLKENIDKINFLKKITISFEKILGKKFIYFEELNSYEIYNEDYRLVIRPSDTENKIRLSLEIYNTTAKEKIINKIEEILSNYNFIVS